MSFTGDALALRFRTTAMEVVRMSMLTRSITLGVLALGVGATALAAQQKPRGYSNYRWYIGGQASYFNFQTTGQTRGWIPSVGGNTMIIAKRTGLLVSVDDALGDNEVATINYAGSATGTQQVGFNDVLRFSFHLLAFPWRGVVEPYIGVGGGIMYAVSPVALNTAGYTPAQLDQLYETIDDLTSTGFASLVGGLQIKGGPFQIFAQYQINTSPARGNAFVGSTQTASAGLRILLGSSRDYNLENR
jgi:hypothetical protein